MSVGTVDIPSLGLSVIAIGIALFTFFFNHKQVKKTEQLKTAMEISSKLDEAENKSFDIKDKLKISANQRELSTYDDLTLRTQLKDSDLLYMNHWEFYSLSFCLSITIQEGILIQLIHSSYFGSSP